VGAGPDLELCCSPRISYPGIAGMIFTIDRLQRERVCDGAVDVLHGFDSRLGCSWIPVETALGTESNADSVSGWHPDRP